MLDLDDTDPNGIPQLLTGFRKHFGPDKGLLDLESWLESKLTILKRRAKRKSRVTVSAEALARLICEVHSRRFDIIARRCAMPRTPKGIR